MIAASTPTNASTMRPTLIHLALAVRLRIRNAGRVMHELVLGTKDEFEFACLIPGHHQAGMVGRIRVTAASGSR
jgi:uncharacterized cupredoxin-like copper-binding protein